ncbi:MAG: S41 family peptidase [Thermaerobacter sp.]|nr:S41 family peptidase [Thermaerobacter sp.]
MRTVIAVLLTVLMAALPLAQPLQDQLAREPDLRQIVHAIERNEWGLRDHPQLLANFKRLAAKDIRVASKPMPYWRYFGIAASLIASVHNPHTVIWPDMQESDYLPVTFYWASDGLVTVPIAGSPRGVALGDRVLAMGGKTPATLARDLAQYVPGSSYNVRYTACRFLLLSARYSLEWLGVVNRQNRVPITLEDAHGHVEHVSLPFVDWGTYGVRVQRASIKFVDEFIAPTGVTVTGAPFGWKVISGHYGVFWLRNFDKSSALNKNIAGFFNAVAQQHAPNIVIDVQGDPGGYGSIVEEFIQTLQKPQYRSRRVYVLTNWGSFSASVLLAELLVLLDNATVVGQPTGEDLEVNGEKNFQTSDGTILYQIAITRPTDALGYEAQALRPSIPVPLTVEDVHGGVNPISNWLATLGPGMSKH